MGKGSILVYVVTILFVTLLVGCDGNENDFPTGVFTARNGFWELILDDDGSFTFSEGTRVEASGTFSIQANEFTWETDNYCDSREAGKATYTWTFEDGILLFQVKGNDKCFDRLDVMDNVPYQIEE